MNWKRGVFRAWSVVSIIWILVLTTVILIHPDLRGDNFSLLGFLTAGVVPPSFLFVVGLAIKWIARGFGS